GRNSPGRGHGAGLEVPITGLPGPGDDCGARHPAPAPARCPPARPEAACHEPRPPQLRLPRWPGTVCRCPARLRRRQLAAARPARRWWLRSPWRLPPRARAHPGVSGSPPGWQITLIAAAALLAAAIAVTVYRRRAVRRRTTASAVRPTAGWAETPLRGAVNGKQADIP